MKQSNQAIKRASTDLLRRTSTLYDRVTFFLLGTTSLAFLAGIWLDPRWLATGVLTLLAWGVVWKSHEGVLDELERREAFGQEVND